MGSILDFKPRYAKKIFSIDPAFSHNGCCGWAIINLDAALFGGVMNTPFISECGVLQPFSSESSLRTMNDLCRKLTEIWRNNSGYSREPSVIVVERPVIYPGSPVRFASIEKLNLFVGMLLKSVAPKYQLSPIPNEWKKNKSKEETQTEIISLLSFNDQTALERDLKSIKAHQRHNVYDAIGLGVYAANVITKKLSPPEMIHFDKDSEFFESVANG